MTTPFASTVATFLLLFLNFNALSAPAGWRVIPSVSVLSMSSVAFLPCVMVRPVGFFGSTTFTVTFALLPPALAVMVALPSLRGVTRPFSTVATLFLLLLHFTAASGVTVAVSLSVSPRFRVTVPFLSRAILVLVLPAAMPGTATDSASISTSSSENTFFIVYLQYSSII